MASDRSSHPDRTSSNLIGDLHVSDKERRRTSLSLSCVAGGISKAQEMTTPLPFPADPRKFFRSCSFRVAIRSMRDFYNALLQVEAGQVFQDTPLTE